MKNRNFIYYLINLVFISWAIMAVHYAEIFDMKFNINEIITLILIFILIHILKFIKIYFILLEEMIPIKRMLKIYIKTTFTSTVLPYKIGELFKMYSYGNQIQNYAKGIIAVLIDKFFDAVILCITLIPYGLFVSKHISNLAWIMLTFIVLVLLVFLSFKGTYCYLNKFFIIKVKNKSSIYALKIIEKSNDIYMIAKEMISGRQTMIFCLSIISWFFEFIFIYTMSGFMKTKASFSTVINYISDAFFGKNNVLFNNYVYLGTAIFLILIMIIYIEKFIKRFDDVEKDVNKK